MAGRATRIEEVQDERRRRKPGSLSRMASLKLALPPGHHEGDGFTYRWANDDKNRIHNLTVADDWEVVQTSTQESSDEASVRRLVGTKADGSPLFAQLLRKPAEFAAEDAAEKRQFLDDQERGLARAASQPAADGSYTQPGNLIKPSGYAP